MPIFRLRIRKNIGHTVTPGVVTTLPQKRMQIFFRRPLYWLIIRPYVIPSPITAAFFCRTGCMQPQQMYNS